jgi:tRNA pseudouridine55 synthase
VAAEPRPEPPAGLLLLDKQAGPSSFAAIAALRPVLGRKVGHAGTLDPFATGLMLVLSGRATRLARYLSGLDKRYLARVQFGTTSTTDDPEGDLEATGGRADEADVRAALPALTGRIEQVPPASSAVHVDGVRAYERFRRGEAVVVPTRQVEVHGLELRRFDAGAQTADVAVHCGAGTYVRSLARDLGVALGCGAHLSALRRTRVGAFAVEDARTVASVRAEGLDGPWWRPPIEALGHLPVRRLTAEERVEVRHGRTVELKGEADAVRCVADGVLVAVARPTGGRLRPELVLEAAG